MLVLANHDELKMSDAKCTESKLLSGLELAGFWAKTGSDRPVPVLHHLLQTASVMDVLLRDRRETAVAEVLEAPLSGNPETMMQLVRLLAALHDIGKVSPGFQGKRPDAMSETLRRVCRTDNARAFGRHHAEVSQWFTERLLRAEFGLPKVIASSLARITGGHHGWYPRPRVIYPSRLESGPWNESRIAMSLAINSTIGLSQESWNQLATAVLTSEWLLLVTGLVTFADWLASSKDIFPQKNQNEHDLSLPEFYASQRRLAQESMVRQGLCNPRLDSVNVGFETLFPEFRQPNELQRTTLDTAAALPDASFLLLEVPTGTGKTEAALAVAASWMKEKGIVGLYFCLPTQATSNQMFERTRDFVGRLLEDETSADLHLLHGRSELSESYEELGKFINQPESSGAQAHDWFRARKRGLLAPFGVGTIDQALFAALNVRHFNLRLTGLAGKAIVVDEVHAYDTYTGSLLLRLLEWLSTLGCRVIVLSATLTADSRRRLMKAWTRGIEPSQTPHPYPCIAALDRSGSMQSVHLEMESNRTYLEAVEPADWLFRIESAAEAGGCVAVVCNTVDEAQATYLWLSKQSSLRQHDLLLLHARFPLQRRIEREKEVLGRFSRRATLGRPTRAVLVATQVIEQSLDLDFDVLFTELAPIDLMIQRIGRLHRHDGRSRPRSHALPRCYWKAPETCDGIPDFDTSAFVYAPGVLMRTWCSLRHRSQFASPDDTEGLVELAYTSVAPSDVSQAELCALTEWDQEFAESRKKQLIQAKQWVVPSPSPELVTGLLSGAAEESESDDSFGAKAAFYAQTRLIPPTVQLVCIVGNTDDWHLLDGTPFDVNEPLNSPAFRRAILLSTVAISNSKWVGAFRESGRPSAWKDHRLLGNLFPAFFTDGELVSPSRKHDGVRLYLSAPLGLVSKYISEE